MAQSRGKQFEQKLKEDFSKIPQSFIYRLHDQVTGYRVTSQNPSDFFAFAKGKLLLLEAKSIQGNTFPISNLTQLDRLLQYRNIPGLRKGVVIWFIDHQKVLYVPAESIKKMKDDGKKSVNIRTIQNDGYDYIDLPSEKRRVFLDTDYSVLLDTPENW